MLNVRFIIEIAGYPKEHIENTMKGVVNKVRNEKKVLNYKIYEAEQKEKLYSTFAEIEIEIKDFDEFVGICFDYMPSSVEILKPDKFNLNSKDFENFVNDLLAKLHQYDMIIKNLKAQNMVLNKELGTSGAT
ncbi:MAG: hypothetical protein KJ896_00870 [Nanoarchaeota archaeon]|nr:hypothetical protein [Nanoarchaeota archaeon]